MRSARGMTARLEPLSDIESLAADWQGLQARAAHRYFLSWGWIGCWLRHLPETVAPLVLRVTDGPSLVSLAVVCPRDARRHGLLRSRSLHLNETGDPRLDELTIEHNGFLVERGAEPAVWQTAQTCFIEALAEKRWDEVFLAAVGEEMKDHWVPPATLRREAVNHMVDLAAIRAVGGDYIAWLGKKTRQHLRRSLRLYGERGEPLASAAATVDEAQAFLTSLIALHQADWQSRGLPGAFADPWIVAFHRALIDARFDQGEIQLLKVSAGDWTLGYLYHFLYEGRVYSYQWGLAPESDDKINFGMVADYLAVMHNLEAGAAVFDFLHGDNLHKRRLGTGEEWSYWLVLQRPRLAFALEDRARDWKRRREARKG